MKTHHPATQKKQQFKGHLDFTEKKIHLLTLELLPNEQGALSGLPAPAPATAVLLTEPGVQGSPGAAHHPERVQL